MNVEKFYCYINHSFHWFAFPNDIKSNKPMKLWLQAREFLMISNQITVAHHRNVLPTHRT